MLLVLKSTSKFVGSAAGLEKTLRILQSLSQIGHGLTLSPVSWYHKAFLEFSLARRYFRLLKWVDCLDQAFQPVPASSKPTTSSPSTTSRENTDIDHLLLQTKWSLLGIYLFLEMFTITNAMRLTSFTWGSWIQREANRFWFLGTFASLILGLYLLSTTTTTSPTRPKSNAKTTSSTPISAAPQTASKASIVKIKKQIICDFCDLFIPAYALGWITCNPAFIGLAMLTSSLIAMRDIWFDTVGMNVVAVKKLPVKAE